MGYLERLWNYGVGLSLISLGCLLVVKNYLKSFDELLSASSALPFASEFSVIIDLGSTLTERSDLVLRESSCSCSMTICGVFFTDGLRF
jgi:hypothetical protein